MILVMGGLYLYAYLSPTIEIKSNGKFYIYDNNSSLVYQGSSSSSWANIEDISDNLKNAIISTEDRNFYKHKGFDYARIGMAIFKNIKNKKVVEGASTISQQYVKNMYLSFDKTWSRKIEEAMLTLEIEVHYSKDEILEGYLNTINFGEGNYGIENASEYYFNKKASDLSLEEACMLAGIPKSPSNYNPVSNYKNSLKRAKIVAKNMYKNGYISKKEYKSLFKEDISIYGERTKENLKTLMYYQDAVLKELKDINSIPDSLIKAGGLKIYTGLDLDIQNNLESAINNNMLDDNQQVASIYVDPNTGEVRALVGGKNYNESTYNRVTMAKRQVGSTIKPFLYYTALSNGLTMASTFESKPTTFNLGDNKTYSPHLFLGEEALVNTMKMVGLKEELSPIPSLALGTKEINMFDYANAYDTLASGGYNRNVHLIKKIEDMDGNLLYEKAKNDELVLNYNYVYILNEMMSNAYNPKFVDYNSPTALSLKGRLTKKYSIKTGTTSNDHWIVGYNKDALLMVWTGTDDNKETNSGYSKITKNIWADAIENSLKDKEDNFYEMPKNIIGVPLNPVTGKYDEKRSVMYYFVKGTEPIIYKKSLN